MALVCGERISSIRSSVVGAAKSAVPCGVSPLSLVSTAVPVGGRGAGGRSCVAGRGVRGTLYYARIRGHGDLVYVMPADAMVLS